MSDQAKHNKPELTTRKTAHQTVHHGKKVIAKNATIAVIGAGGMGRAIINGLIRSKCCYHNQFIVADHHQEKLDHIARDARVRTTRSAVEALSEKPDVIFICVKPQSVSDLIDEIGDAIANSLIISIAVGVTLAELEENFGDGTRIVRAMPTVCAKVCKSATAVVGGTWATDDDLDLVEELFDALGVVRLATEKQLEAVAAVIGAAPAYFALFEDTLTRAGILHGLNAPGSREMVNITMEGVAAILSDSGEHPRAFCEHVCSPGGTTAYALKEIEPHLEKGAYQAVDAALERSEVLRTGAHDAE